ncbi:DUF6802 family protein [Prescottella equi]|uniref:DUF6802 domain-containing protein n=1 Tax=Rhodococcus hoagii TaxID=43767 RepID=A0AAE5MJE8_RHOHA|nr:DUF6802 family protein [Prescottella equi]ERN43720.1 hypothetical protein H849_21095 [Prescottella equi NBRC 101255 = C 7]MBM4627967.1 hypothetical protein [Prescottella equi]ORL26249.1 hypothetical protein A6I89_16575 [Prescottella equi]ORM03249.1 hypothetical protein A5N73_10250 [Prescottella equi]ORM28419.1 hypothetical protein A5N68_09910 [Prescottella equi]
MISTADLQGMPGPEIDPDTFGADSPAAPLTDAVFDIDDDGVLDTRTFEVDDALVVATDTDGDGDADHVTIVEGDGDFSAWEFHRDADGRERWERTDSGTLGGA